MNQETFTSEEILPFSLIVALVGLILLVNYLKGYRYFWSPLSIIAIVFAYYCCLGPYEAITSGDTYDRLINMRKFYEASFWASFIALVSYVSGYLFHGRTVRTRPLPELPDDFLHYYGIRLFAIGFVLFTISTGGNVLRLINPLDAQYVEQVGGSIANYLGLSINFLIPGLVLLSVHYFKTRKGLLLLIGLLVVTTGLFVTIGFRYRLVLLFGAIAIVCYQFAKKRPNPFLIVGAVIVFISLMGIINLTRQYNAGLSVSRLESRKSDESYYRSGLRESLIFQTTGAVIDMVPDRHPYAGFQPIVSTLLFPIPSAIYKDKNSAEYLFSFLDAVYGKKYSKGAAILSFGEYYLAFGWFGLIGGCFLVGWIFRKLWNWFLFNYANSWAIAAYAVTVVYLYVILSRGYLPQVTNLFVFSVLPVFVVLSLAKKRVRRLR